MNPPVAMTIAGSDSGGGAGIQADLKTFAALGVFGTSAITALTAQNTVGVRGVHAVPASFVVEQIEAVLDDLPVAAAKTGMLATAEIVQAVAKLAGAGRLPRLVVDPVMVASSGDRLLEPEAERLYVEELLPHASVVTPNLKEAEVLLGRRITTLSEQREAAAALGSLGPATVVVKGGHAVSDTPGEGGRRRLARRRRARAADAPRRHAEQSRQRLFLRLRDRGAAGPGRTDRARGRRGQGLHLAGGQRWRALVPRRRPWPAGPLRLGSRAPLSACHDPVRVTW
jgi:hydroxymethylpyrimidine kinase/phosphomethylpyrimidine kinase